MTEWIQKYVDHLSTKKTPSAEPQLTNSESQQIFEAKQKIKLYMMRGSPDSDGSESESSDDNDDDFIKYESEEDKAKVSTEKTVSEKAAQNKDILPNKVDRMLLPLFDSEAALPALPALTKGQKAKPVPSNDSVDPYSKFGAISVEASEVQIGRRNTVNDDLKNIFKVMNKAKPPVPAVPAVSPALKKRDSVSRTGQLYNTLQAEFVKSQYKPRWTDSTIEMISEASQTDLLNLPVGVHYDHKQGGESVGSDPPPNSMLSLAQHSEEQLNESSDIAKVLLQAAKERTAKVNQGVGDETMNRPVGPGLVHKQKAINDDLKDLFKLIKVKESSSQTNTMSESDKTSSESVRISVGSSIAGIYNTLNAEFKTQYKPKWTGSSLESVEMTERPSQTEVPMSYSEESQELMNRLKLGKWGESSQESVPSTGNPFHQTEAHPSEDSVATDLKEVFPSFSRILKTHSSNDTPYPMWTESLNTMDHHDNSQTDIVTNEAVYCSNLSIDSMPWVPFPSKSTSLNDNSLKVHLSGASVTASSLDSSRGRSLLINSNSSRSTQTESRRKLRLVPKASRVSRGSRRDLATSPRYDHRNSATSPRQAISPRQATSPRRNSRDSIVVHNLQQKQYKRSSLATHNNHRQVTKFVERIIDNALEQEDLELILEGSSIASSSYPDTISISPPSSQDLLEDDLADELELENGEGEEYENTQVNSAYEKFRELLEVQQSQTESRESLAPPTHAPPKAPKAHLTEEDMTARQRKTSEAATARQHKASDATRVKPSGRNEVFWDRVKQPLTDTISPRLNGNTVVTTNRLKPGMLHTLQISSSFNHPGIVVEECWLYWRITAKLTYGSIQCDGRVSVGDVVFAVNGTSVRGLSKGKIRQLFYQCSKQEEYSISVLAFDERWGGYNATMAQVKELLRSKDMSSLKVTSHPALDQPSLTHITHSGAEPSSSSSIPPILPLTPRSVDQKVQKMDLDMFIKEAFYTKQDEITMP